MNPMSMNATHRLARSRPGLTCLSLLLVAVLPTAAANAAPVSCPVHPAVAIWTSPLAPRHDVPVRVMAVMTDAPADSLVAVGPNGDELPLKATPRGGPPWSLAATLPSGSTGVYRIEVRRGGERIACRSILVGAGGGGEPSDGPAVDDWNATAEAFFSAWVERLFDGPPEETLSWPSLEPVLRDPDRNFLFDHFGAGEDRRLRATPDCADLPYFLRAYFAWKIGLPVSFRACDRGSATRPPRCGAPVVDQSLVRRPASAAQFSQLARRLEDTVQSGSARTGLDDEATDFYPVELTRETLPPGTIFADPYGHTLVVASWVPQTSERNGLLLAVDAQPDNSVARKRFWEGNFLFDSRQRGAGPGFKTFRPLLRDSEGRLRLPGNQELAVNAPQARFSDEQATMSAEDFYARIGRLTNPRGLPPERAYDAMLDALVEQLETRVRAIENGEAYRSQGHAEVIPMPTGAAIFETSGPWEDYSTPSRDLRLLIALATLERLPQRIVQYPDLFVLDGQTPAQARAAIEQRHALAIEERRISYPRSDGSEWELSVAEVYRRRPALEVGYDPNDCPEVRWGAEPDTAERATCRRRAPADQQARMEQYRPWFHEMRRPPR
jgi:hypothetical protein